MFLSDLNIRNLTVIQDLTIQFQPGLICLTGETGAGKSIMLNALDMVLGARARTDMIREGEQGAQITAQFQLAEGEIEVLNQQLDSHGLPLCESGQLLVRRALNKNGRHRQWINEGLTTAAVIRELIGPFVDMTGQHSQQRLLKSSFQRETLDAYGGLTAQASEVTTAFDAVMRLQEEVESLQIDEEEKLRKQDWLQYQIDEILEVAPQKGEDESLAIERKRLAGAAQSQKSLSMALDDIAEGQPNALDLLKRAQVMLNKASQNDPELEKIVKQLDEANVLIDETHRDLNDYSMHLQADPERLHALDERLNVLYRLERKHNKSLDELESFHQELEDELQQLLDLDAHLLKMETELDKRFKNLDALTTDLAKKRNVVAKSFAEEVTKELVDLGMPHARFEVSFEPLKTGTNKNLFRQGKMIGRYGLSNISFVFAANPGQKMGALQIVASGGELSRTLLALKRALQMADPVPITVFDEVDAGVGGAIGEIIGKKLAQVGQLRQVFCVTHLGQIAAQADEHCRVSKEVVKGETETVVQVLKGEQRIMEVARMIGGEEMTSVTLEHASEMVKSGTQRVALS